MTVSANISGHVEGMTEESANALAYDLQQIAKTNGLSFSFYAGDVNFTVEYNETSEIPHVVVDTTNSASGPSDTSNVSDSPVDPVTNPPQITDAPATPRLGSVGEVEGENESSGESSTDSSGTP